MKNFHILLIEDNEGDIYITTEALEEQKTISKISVARNGQEGIDFLQQAMDKDYNSLPDLILLDINLPLKNGYDVLTYVKDNPVTRTIPVIILTTSSSESDILQSYSQHANCFITKPDEVEDFYRFIEGVVNFWGSVVKLPTKKSTNEKR